MSRRQTVNILLYDARGRFLLQRRTQDAPVLPGYWAFFGGGVKAGETLRQALERESLEELGYLPAKARLEASKDFVIRGEPYRMHVFTQRYSGPKGALRLGEGAGWGWFTPAETAGLKLCSRDRRMLALLERNGKVKCGTKN